MPVVLRILAVALVVLLVQQVLAGTEIDLGPGRAHWAAGGLALGLGVGLLWRPRLPKLVDALLLALLVPARGPLCDALSGLAAPLVALLPLGLALGWTARAAIGAGALDVLAGWVLGTALAALGGAGWMPGEFSGVLVAAVLVVAARSAARPGPAGPAEPGPPTAWEALPIGFVLGTLVIAFRRVVPQYAEPPGQLTNEITLAFLLPALVVAWPASVLARSSRGARLILAVGSLVLGVAVWWTATRLSLYLSNDFRVAFTFRMKQLASGVSVDLEEWHAWLVVLAGFGAASLGLVLGALRGGWTGPLSLGVAASLLAQEWVVHDGTWAPFRLIVIASGVATLTALAAWRRWMLLALPLAALTLLAYPQQMRAGYDHIFRVGELANEGFRRTLPGDVVLFSTSGPTNPSAYGRAAYRRSFSHREPLLGLRAAEDTGPTPEELADLDPDEVGYAPKRYYGLRIGGTTLHAGHDPLGPAGSVGRLSRLFGVPGRALVLGGGAELLASDLTDAGIAREVEVGTSTQMGQIQLRVLFDLIGTGGYERRAQEDPWAVMDEAVPESFDTVMVAPVPRPTPGTDGLLAAESLQRMAALLDPGGRCLAWIDTTGLDGRSLRARLAAFGTVFGERSAAFVEMREQDPPLVLLVGWRDDAGSLRSGELVEHWPEMDPNGRRSRLAGWDDLAAHLLIDGPGLARMAARGPVHRRGRPIPTSLAGPGGWTSVEQVLEGPGDLGMVIPGIDAAPRDMRPVARGLAAHQRYSYHLDRLEGAMMIETLPDVDWSAFDDEVGAYAQAATDDVDHPLLHLAVAAFLEPLATEGDLGRMARSFERIGGEQLASWRLALLQAYVLEQVLESEAAAEARARAEAWTIAGQRLPAR